MNDRTVAAITLLLMFGILGTVIYISMYYTIYVLESRQEARIQFCKDSGYTNLDFSGYLVYSKIIDGQEYIKCYTEHIVNQHLNRTEAWIPYIEP